MTIRITDNLLTKPLYPGGQSDGTESVTRQFGNRTEQFAQMPNVPNGWGGAVNRYAGSEYKALAANEQKHADNARIEAQGVARQAEANTQAAQAVESSVQNVVQYMEAAKLADADSRQKSRFLRIQADAKELRRTLASDLNLANQSIEVQQMAYEMQRDIMVEKHIAEEDFTHPKVRRLVDDKVQQFKMLDSDDYNERVLIPAMVNSRKQRNSEDVATIVGTAMVEQTPEATAKAASIIENTFSTEDANATYTAAGAAQLKIAALGTLKKGLVNSFLTKADDDLIDIGTKVGIQGIITRTDIESGRISLLIEDKLFQLDQNLIQAGANESERFLEREKYQKTLKTAARSSAATHNEAYKAAVKEQNELRESSVIAMGDSLFERASRGAASESLINKTSNQALRDLGIDPVAAAEGKLTDPDQIKLSHKVLTQVTRARSEQRRVQRENERDSRDREMMRLQQELLIMPSTQKGSNVTFTDFAKSNGLSDKPVLAYSPEEWGKFNTYMQRASPTHLPAAVEQAITYGLNSNDPIAAKQGLLAYENLVKNAPGLAAQVPVRYREIALRLREGQDLNAARAAVDADALRTPDQKKAINTTATKTMEEWKKGDAHPIAKEMGVKHLPPAILALADREYTDAIARGESPEVAKQTMMAKVAARASTTTLMSPDGKPTLSVNAPEKRFNVGVNSSPGWFARNVFGAQADPNTVTNDILRNDIKEALTANGYPEDEKFYLGQPIERGGKPFYPILRRDEDGAEVGPAIGADGSPIMWTFDPDNNAEIKKAREKTELHKEEVKFADLKKRIQIEHDTLMDEARRQGRLPLGAREFKKFEHDLYQQAAAKVKGQEE